MASNEKEIRQFFKDKLNKQFPNSFTYDEFSGGALNTRPDLATFMPNDIMFTEIKSDKDTLDRLDSQSSDYSRFASFVYIVLDIKHHKKWVAKYKNKYPIGYTYFYDNGKLYYANDILSTEVDEIHYYEYPSLKTDILHFLWKDEKYYFTGFIKGRTKILSDTLVIHHLYTAREIVDISHNILYDRARERSKSKTGKILTYNQGSCDIENTFKEHRQILFNNIKCGKSKKGIKQ